MEIESTMTRKSALYMLRALAGLTVLLTAACASARDSAVDQCRLPSAELSALTKLVKPGGNNLASFDGERIATLYHDKDLQAVYVVGIGGGCLRKVELSSYLVEEDDFWGGRVFDETFDTQRRDFEGSEWTRCIANPRRYFDGLPDRVQRLVDRGDALAVPKRAGFGEMQCTRLVDAISLSAVFYTATDQYKILVIGSAVIVGRSKWK